MKLSDSEIKERNSPASIVSEGPRYPWGLGIQLEDETMGKLGIAGLPKVGDVLMVQARVKVTGAMENEHEHGKHRSAQLQIVDMGIGPDEGEGGDAAEKLYDGKG